MTRPLLPTVRPIVETEINKRISAVHPGLRLDKYAHFTEMENQKAELESVCKTTGDQDLLDHLHTRRSGVFKHLKAVEWKGTTSGTLTLHVSRAGALENAGISLHPLYGFVNLPASGLKGLARAYASTLWREAQDDKAVADETIKRIFGAKPEASDADIHSGSVVFHDAWPITWPQLFVDITNNHHPDYYGKEGHPPGDWEDPKPVYFLAIKNGQQFSFGLSTRHKSSGKNDLLLAQQLLVHGMMHLGAGAKTNPGYGTIMPENVSTHTPDPATGAFQLQYHVSLTTPAYAAGASRNLSDCRLNTDPSDCEFRPATLRGLLRWWWRTLHAKHVDVPTLKALESLVWGSTSLGGPVRIRVQPDGRIPDPTYSEFVSCQFDNRHNENRLLWNPDFSQMHDLYKPYDSPSHPLLYLSYGMNESGTDREGNPQSPRFMIPSGAKWTITFRVRDGGYISPKERDKKSANPKSKIEVLMIKSADIKEQIDDAMRLFLSYGGFGGKARKGFGSLSDDNPPPDFDNLSKRAAEFRKLCHIEEMTQDNCTAAIEEAILVNYATPFSDYYKVLYHTGYAYQKFATSHAHDTNKARIGFPRKMSGIILQIGGVSIKRYSSPLHIHIAPSNKHLTLRIIAFPSPYLPNKKDSELYLRAFLAEFTVNFERSVNLGGGVDRIKAQQSPVRNQVALSVPIGDIPAQNNEAEYEKFMKWYNKENFSKHNKHKHNSIIKRIESLTPHNRERAIRYVREKLVEGIRGPGLKEFLSDDN